MNNSVFLFILLSIGVGIFIFYRQRARALKLKLQRKQLDLELRELENEIIKGIRHAREKKEAYDKAKRKFLIIDSSKSDNNSTH